MVRPASERASWDAFLASRAPPTFLQSWAWGETQRALGEEVIRLEAAEGGETVGVAQAVTVTARRARFLDVPHGPITLGPGASGLGPRQVAKELLTALRDEAERRGLAFLRVSPVQEDTGAVRTFYRGLGFRPAPIHLHAERVWILNLAPSEEALLAGMRKTTRNLIRRAEREGVRVRLSRTPEDLPSFLRLYRETARRERFVPFSDAALEAEFRAFAADGSALLALAERERELLAAAMILFTPWSAFYHHGASSRTQPHVPAAYALQWAVIREARNRGVKEYNFWGIAAQQRHPWAGLTLFKTGFGGREVPLVPAQDLPLSFRYWPAFVLDTWRRRTRGV